MHRSRSSRWLLWLILPLVSACGSTTRDPMGLGDLGDGLKVLFVGNSLTYFNDLPNMVQVVGEATGHQIAVRSVTRGNFALEDHWVSGEALEVIQAAPWDVVILQQGPSSLALNKINLREWSGVFSEAIRGVGARPALFMVWPEASRPAAFDAVSDAYTQAAEAVDGILMPVGEAWRTAWEEDASLAFYGPDGFHPTELGSALGALVIFQQLFDESPIGLPSHMVPTTRGLEDLIIPSHLTALLQEAAAKANAQYGRK